MNENERMEQIRKALNTPTAEKLFQIRRKLNDKGDISFEDADFVLNKQRFAREQNEKILHLLYSDILKKLEKGESGNFVCAIPYMSHCFPVPPTKDEPLGTIYWCNRYLGPHDRIKSISLPYLGPEKKELFEKYQSFFDDYKDYNGFYTKKFHEHGWARRTGFPIDKMASVETGYPWWIFQRLFVLSCPDFADDVVAINLTGQPKSNSRKISRDTMIVALLKKMDIPAIMVSYFAANPCFKDEKDSGIELMIPKEQYEKFNSTLKTIMTRIDLMSLWEKNFGGKFIKKGEMEKFTEIVLMESSYMDIEKKERDIDDDFMEIAR